MVANCTATPNILHTEVYRQETRQKLAKVQYTHLGDSMLKKKKKKSQRCLLSLLTIKLRYLGCQNVPDRFRIGFEVWRAARLVYSWWGDTFDSQNISFSDHKFLGACFTMLLFLDERSSDAHIVAKHLLWCRRKFVRRTFCTRPQHTSESCLERKILKFDLKIFLNEGQHLSCNSGHN